MPERATLNNALKFMEILSQANTHAQALYQNDGIRRQPLEVALKDAKNLFLCSLATGIAQVDSNDKNYPCPPKVPRAG